MGIPIDEVVLLGGQKIGEIPPEIVGNWSKELWLQVPVKEMVMMKGEQFNNMATLAKLGIDALASLNQGELDISLLTEEVKILLLEELARRYNLDGEDVQAKVAVVQGVLVDLIEDWEESKAELVTAEVNLHIAENTPYKNVTEREEAIIVAKSQYQLAEQANAN